MKKIVQGILTATMGMITGAVATEKILSKPLKKNQDNAEKFQMLFMMMNQWVELKQRGVSLSKFFEENGYKRVAIYGMSTVGETLYNELKETDIEVLYVIDKNKYCISTELDVYSPDEDLPNADAIIVTAIAYFDEIATMLEEKVNCPIISLEDVICNV